MARSSSTTNMVDDLPPSEDVGGCCTPSGGARARLGKEALRKAHQLLRPDGLVQMHATMAGNLAQAIGRDVACQDDGRDCALSLLLQPGDGLEPVEALRQVVVGDDQVRHGQPWPPTPAPCAHPRRPACDDPRRQKAAAAFPALPDRPRRSGSCRGRVSCRWRLVLARNRQFGQLRLAQAAPRW